MSIIKTLQTCCHYYKLSKLGQELITSKELLNYVTPAEDRGELTYELSDINTRGLSLIFSTDSQRVLEVSIMNNIPVVTMVVCSINLSSMNPEFIIQSIVNSCEITSDNTGLGIGTLKISELGNLMLYISVPISWKDVNKYGISRIIGEITETAYGIIVPCINKEIDNLLNLEAMFAENNVSENDEDDDEDNPKG